MNRDKLPKNEYDDKLEAFLRELHPTGRYAIYVVGPKDEIVGFARAYTKEAPRVRAKPHS